MRDGNTTGTWLLYSALLIVVVVGVLWGLATYAESRTGEPATQTFQQ